MIATFNKSQRDIQNNEEPQFAVPGYARWDILTQWDLNEAMNINLAINNLLDKNYWQNSNILGFAKDDPTLPLLAEAGLSAAISVNYSF